MALVHERRDNGARLNAIDKNDPRDQGSSLGHFSGDFFCVYAFSPSILLAVPATAIVDFKRGVLCDFFQRNFGVIP